MSAECGKCGFDIVYPPGTWPVGECLNCKQANKIDALLAENQRLREIAEAAEELIERTVTDLVEVGRREVRLSALLRQWRAAR